MRSAIISIAAIGFLLSCTLAWGADPTNVPDHLKPQVERIRKLREEQLGKLRQQLEALKAKLRSVSHDREKRTSVAKEIARVEKQIKTFEEKLLPSCPLNSFRLSVGQFGSLDAEQLEVLQVLGPEKMLVIPLRRGTSLAPGRYSASGLRSALQSAVLELEEGPPMIIYGWPTQGMTDSQKLKPRGLFEVTGTERYTSVAGAVRTVFTLTWYDTDALLPYLKGDTPAATTRHGHRSPYVSRTWTDSTGKFTVEAKYRGVVGGKVRLEKADGSIVFVPIERLSKRDQEWISGKRERPSEEGRPQEEQPPRTTEVEERHSGTAELRPASGDDVLKGPFAEVRVLSGGEFVPLKENTAINTTGRYLYWSKIPAEYAEFRFLRNREQQGTTRFQVTRPGLVLIVVTTRWRNSGSSGHWQEEIVTRDELVAEGWKEVGRLSSYFKTDGSSLEWIVFARSCRAGESFSIRTEKYVAPVLLLK